jgi:hypothetical protein
VHHSLSGGRARADRFAAQEYGVGPGALLFLQYRYGNGRPMVGQDPVLGDAAEKVSAAMVELLEVPAAARPRPTTVALATHLAAGGEGGDAAARRGW